MKKIILVIGPESSGTRIFASYIGQHPDVIAPKGKTHDDVLNRAWNFLEQNNIEKAQEEIEKLLELKDTIVTRRSLPHGREVGQKALFMDFKNADIEKLYQTLQSINVDIKVLITSRSPVANLVSWSISRASCNKQMKNAIIQYKSAYKMLFSFLVKNDIDFYIVSMEGVLLDGADYVRTLFHFLGLKDFTPKIAFKKDVNKNRYKCVLEKWGIID